MPGRQFWQLGEFRGQRHFSAQVELGPDHNYAQALEYAGVLTVVTGFTCPSC
jgi:hypothetical protein